MRDAGDVKEKRNEDENADSRRPVKAARKKQKQQRRPQQIELFFHAKRPEVQQGLGVRGRVEVAGLFPEE